MSESARLLEPGGGLAQLEILDQPRHVCALGAMQTVQAISRGVPVLHAGPGCAQKLAGGLAADSGDSGYLAPQVYPCTNITERETIFGGEDRLTETLEAAVRVVDGDLYVVLTGCTPEIVGDDIHAVVGRADTAGKPVVTVQTAGFKGSNLQGHDWVVNAIIDQYLVGRPEAAPIAGLVNLWGPVPSYDPFWVGTIRVLEDLLRELGLTPNTIFGEYRGVANLDRVPQAQLNLLVSPWVGRSSVELLRERFGTPYLHQPVLPIGAYETSRFLRAVGEAAGVDPKLVAEVIDRHELEYYYHIERASDVFLENRTMSRRFSVVSSATDTLAVSRFLVNDFGLVPATQFVTDATPVEYQQDVREYFEGYQYGITADVVFSTDGYQIHQSIREQDFFGPPLIVGSIYEKQLAESLGGNFLAVSAPLNERLVLSSSYAGYRGGLRLLEDVYGYVLKKFN